MLKKIVFLLLFLSSINMGYSQSNVIKLSSISTSNPYNDSFFEFERSSFAMSYEYANWNHSTLEGLVMLCRSISYHSTGLPIPVAGPGVELKWRYYFQTNPNFVTYAPYGWYAAPTVGYSQMSGTNTIYDQTFKDVLNPITNLWEQVLDPTPIGDIKHQLSYVPVGVLAGYHFIMEEYEYGVTFDFAIGANYIATADFKEERFDTSGTGKIFLNGPTVQTLNQIIPKFHFSIGFAF